MHEWERDNISGAFLLVVGSGLCLLYATVLWGQLQAIVATAIAAGILFAALFASPPRSPLDYFSNLLGGVMCGLALLMLAGPLAYFLGLVLRSAG